MTLLRECLLAVRRRQGWPEDGLLLEACQGTASAPGDPVRRAASPSAAADAPHRREGDAGDAGGEAADEGRGSAPRPEACA